MIRILILLMALNTIFTPVNFASACASDMSKSHLVERQDGNQTSSASLNEDASVISHAHCDHCDDDGNNMKAMDCDTECSITCLAVSVALTVSTTTELVQSKFSKPVSGYINFYTRSLSPELHPPLV